MATNANIAPGVKISQAAANAAVANAPGNTLGATQTPTPAVSNVPNQSGSGGSSPTPPAPAPVTPTPAGTNTYPYNPGGAAPADPSYSMAQGNIAPATPQTDEEFFNSVYSQLQPAIDAASAAESAAEQAANIRSTQTTSANNFSLGSRGLSGSSEADAMSIATENQRQSDIATAKASQASAVAGVVSTAVSQGYDEYKDALSRSDTNSQNYINTVQTTLKNTLTGLGEQGIVSGDALLKSNPKEYTQLLQYFNNDPDALNSALILATPQNKVVQSWTSGSTYNQLITDPITGQPHIQSLDMGVTVPTSWVAQKIGTTATVMTDPNNAANTVIYSTNPFTGQVTINGTGTGLQLLTAQGITPGGSAAGSDTSTSTSTSTGPGTASTTVSTALGVDPSTSLSDVINSKGIGSVVAAIIQNEGGSPSGVQNNPGNVKYQGLPGQTDSGVKATDGGTFASYDTAADGQQAVANLVQGAAAGQSANYGASPTLQSFVDTYTNTGSTGNSLDPKEYGLLSTVPGFNPSTPGLDQDAFNYIKSYLSGSSPSTSSGMGGASLYGTKQQIQARAQDIYFKATGQQLPNQTVLATNLGLVSNNNTLLNNLNVQEGTIQKNFGLNLENLTNNNVNQAAPVINNVADTLAKMAGNVPVAQYLTQNATIQQEIGSLLSIKNASGVTVADKIAAGDLLPSDLSADQQKQILTTLMAEAQNQRQTIGQANLGLYQQTDPLGLDPQNPINAPGYQDMTSANFTNNFDGTWTSPDGTQTVSIDPQGNVTVVQ